LAVEVGNAYMRVARVQGVPISQNLGQLAQAFRRIQVKNLADSNIAKVLRQPLTVAQAEFVEPHEAQLYKF